eukprot:symbB.v1.2.033272.t1/scaffold4105.1/size64512/4
MFWMFLWPPRPCSAAARALALYLQRQFPQAEVVQKFNGSAPEGMLSEDLSGDGADEEFDFALQVYAPVLFRSPESKISTCGVLRCILRDRKDNGNILLQRFIDLYRLTPLQSMLQETQTTIS